MSTRTIAPRSHDLGKELMELASKIDSHVVEFKDVGMVPLEFLLIVQIRCELILLRCWEPWARDNRQLLWMRSKQTPD